MVVVLINDDDDEAQQSISDFSDLSRRSLMKNKIIFWNLQMKIDFKPKEIKAGMSLHSTMFTVCKI